MEQGNLAEKNAKGGRWIRGRWIRTPLRAAPAKTRPVSAAAAVGAKGVGMLRLIYTQYFDV